MVEITVLASSYCVRKKTKNDEMRDKNTREIKVFLGGMDSEKKSKSFYALHFVNGNTIPFNYFFPLCLKKEHCT